MNVVRENITHQSEIESYQHALGAVRDFSAKTRHLTGTSRDLGHPKHTALVLQDFTKDVYPSAASYVALLHDLPDRLRKPQFKDAAKLALRTFFESVAVGTTAYSACLLGDMPVIERAAESYRNMIRDDDEDYEDVIRHGKRIHLPDDYWLKKGIPVDSNVMYEALKKTNLESAAIKAAEGISNIITPPPNEAALLRDIVEAESFHAPLNGFLRFDGFAMASRSVASEKRLEMSGNHVAINKASELLATVATEERINFVFDGFWGSGTYDHSRAVGNESGLNIAIGDINAEVGGSVYEGRWRIKSLGSTAIKVLEKKHMPYDIAAMTLFAEDEEQASKLLRDVINEFISRKDKQSFAVRAAQYSNVGVNIRGDDKYVEKFENAIDGIELQSRKIKKNGKGSFRIAKAVFSPTVESPGNDLPPLEVQVVTEKQREENRYGKYAHAGYKGKGLFRGRKARAIRDRRDRVRPDFLEVNGQSKKRGIDLLREVGVEITPELSALLS